MLASQRNLFDVPRDVCYLNSASYSPLPLRTLEAGRAAVGRKGRPWTLDADFARGQHERARTAAARLINADPADVALIPSVSYGVATAAKVLTIARGARYADCHCVGRRSGWQRSGRKPGPAGRQCDRCVEFSASDHRQTVGVAEGGMSRRAALCDSP